MACYKKGVFIGIVMKIFKWKYRPGIVVLNPYITEEQPATFVCFQEPTRSQSKDSSDERPSYYSFGPSHCTAFSLCSLR